MGKEKKENKYRSAYYFITGVICGGLLIYVSSLGPSSHTTIVNSAIKNDKTPNSTWAALMPQLTVRYDYTTDRYYWRISLSNKTDGKKGQ